MITHRELACEVPFLGHTVLVLKAASGSRTRDLELGKLALYQLSYRRVEQIVGDRLYPRKP
jgi:hypothetical protein